MLTIYQAAMMNPGEVHRNTVVRIFAENNPILERLPFTDIAGGAYTFTKEQELPDVGFRAINGAFSESTGKLGSYAEQLAIMGGDVAVDRVLVRRHGMGIRAKHEEMKVLAMAHRFANNFFKGDRNADANAFDGLQKRAVGDRIIINGGSAGAGVALSLTYLDAAISNTSRPTAIYLGRKLKLRLDAVVRNQAIAGNFGESRDLFGRPLTTYGGLPLLEMDRIDDPYGTLGFTELSPDGTSNSLCTSIYVVSMGPNGVIGIQNPGGIDVRDLGETKETGKSNYITRVDWEVSIVPEGDYSVTRLAGITDAVVTA